MADIKWLTMQLIPRRHVWAGEVAESEDSPWVPAACVWWQWLGVVLWSRWTTDADEVRRLEPHASAQDVVHLPGLVPFLGLDRLAGQPFRRDR